MNIYAYKQYPSRTKMIFQRSDKPISDAPGCRALFLHLKAAKNFQERTEWDGARYVKIIRPQDFEYAKSWVKNTNYLLSCERGSILDALKLAEDDRTIWLLFE